jgi:hypothetical protein
MLSVSRLYRVAGTAINEYGAVGRMKIFKGNRNALRKIALVPLCPSQISHDVTRARIEVGPPRCEAGG